MFAAVDLGSNSFRLHIGTHEGDEIRIVKSAREPIRLGAGMDAKGNLTEKAMLAAIRCLGRFAAILEAYPLQAVRVVGTNAMRIAGNAGAFLPLAEQAIGHPIEIISGEEEGRLIYMGVSCALGRPDERRLVIDIGGGSTELILGKGHEIAAVDSFSVGTVPHNASFFASGRLDGAAFDAALWSARSYFEDAAQDYRPPPGTRVYGSSGTIRAIAGAIDSLGAEGGPITLTALEDLQQRLIGFGETGRIAIPGLKPDRTNSIAGGLAILLGVMQELGIEAMTPVDAGLRMGVLWDLHLRATRRDRRELAILGFAQRFHADPVRAARVAGIASALYAQQKPSADGHARPLYWSGLLHEVGMAVSHSGYHKHGAYLVANADLAGFTTREQRLMSSLVLGQKGNLRKLGESLSNPDFLKAVLALRLALLFMHARIEEAPGGIALRTKSRIELEVRRAWLDQHHSLGFWLEKEAEHWREVGMDFSLKASG